MNKGDLVEAIAKKNGLSKEKAKQVLDTMLDSVTSSLKKKDSVTLPGFGTFDVSKRKAREGRNPATGEKIKIPAMKVPKFKAGKALKEAVK